MASGTMFSPGIRREIFSARPLCSLREILSPWLATILAPGSVAGPPEVLAKPQIGIEAPSGIAIEPVFAQRSRLTVAVAPTGPSIGQYALSIIVCSFQAICFHKPGPIYGLSYTEQPPGGSTRMNVTIPPSPNPHATTS